MTAVNEDSYTHEAVNSIVVQKVKGLSEMIFKIDCISQFCERINSTSKTTLVQYEYIYESKDSKLLFDAYSNVILSRLSLEDAVALSQGNHENARILYLKDVASASEGIRYLLSNDKQFEVFTTEKVTTSLKIEWELLSYAKFISTIYIYKYIESGSPFVSPRFYRMKCLTRLHIIFYQFRSKAAERRFFRGLRFSSTLRSFNLRQENTENKKMFSLNCTIASDTVRSNALLMLNFWVPQQSLETGQELELSHSLEFDRFLIDKVIRHVLVRSCSLYPIKFIDDIKSRKE